MPEDYRVIIYRFAQDDVQTSLNYISSRSPRGAIAWHRAFLAAVDKIRERPMAYALAHENDSVEEEIREVLFKTRHGLPYRIVYTIHEDQVRILRVRGPGQDLLEQEDIPTSP
jgi:plasmid stabilization system protein ParE